MRKPTTRLFALVLCVLLLVSQLGLTDSVAVETEDPAEPVQTSEQVTPPELTEQSEPAEEPVADPVEEPASEPAEVPVAEVTEAPAPEVTEAPAPEVTKAPAPEVTEAPAPEITEAPVPEVTEAPAPEITEAPVPEVTEAPVAEVTEAPAPEITEAPAPEVTEAPAEEPVADEEPEPEIATIAGIMPMVLMADITLSVTEPTTATAGTAITEITLTANGGTFAEDPGNTNFSVEGPGVTIASVDTAKRQTDTNIVKLGVSNCTPTSQGALTIQVNKEAFSPEQPTEDHLTATIAVNAAPDPTVTASGSLKAGTAKGTIDLEITSSDNTFAQSTPTLYTLKCDSGDNLTVESVTLGAGSGNNTKATLTVNEAPTKKGSVTVTIQPTAFQYQPDKEVTVNDITVGAADTPTVTASSTDLFAGKAGGTITLDASPINFASDPDKGLFTITGVEGLTVDSVDATAASATLTVTGTPKEAGALIVTIDPTAFQFQPASEVEAKGASVAAPTGTLEAALEGTLYAGTKVNGQTVKLTITDSKGLTFKSGATAGDFSLTGEGSTGLEISKVEVKDGVVTLTLGGTPTNSGTVTITADKDKAFTIAPDADKTATITVNAAPEVTLSTDKTTTTGVEFGQVILTASSTVDSVKFADSVGADKFELSGDPSSNLTVSTASATGNTATLNITGKPTTAGELTITVPADAFNPVASGEVKATITVKAVEGTVTASLEGGTLTAGTAVSGQTIKLTISEGNLTFKNSGLATTDFELGDGSEGLSISDSGITVGEGGKTVTLTLTGTPEKGGSFDVTVNTSAFAVEPTDGQPVKATPSIDVGYPNITLKATADPPLIEDEDVSEHTITLTATDGVFNTTTETGNFSVSGVVGISGVASVNANGTTATLTLSGKPTATGTLTITVAAGAFQYQPKEAVTATVNVAQPSGAITVALVGDLLYAGTPVTNQTITVTIDKDNSHGLEFKADLSPDAFTLSGGGAGGLAIDTVSVDGDTVTLKLKDTPTTAGDITVTAQTSAFKFAPAAGIAATNAITVKAAPTITLTVEPTTVPQGLDVKTITLTADGGTFAEPEDESGFTVNNGLSVSGVEISNEGKTATLTVTGAPSTVDDITVTAKKEAFVIYPADAPTATIAVKALDGTVSAKLNNGPLTAGTAVTTQTITLEITDTNGLTFKTDIAATDFQLDVGSEGLKIESVEKAGDTTVTLILSGTPAAQGEFTVTAETSAFTVKPTDGEGRMSTNKISIAYPTIELSAAPKDVIYEGEEVDNNPITVTATGGVFDGDAIEVEGNITISGIAGLTLESVVMGQIDNTVILYLKGVPEDAGTLTITVKKEAFKYQPKDNLTATVEVKSPTGTVTAKLNGDPLYAGTPVNGQTVTLTIGESSHGLQFQEEDKLNINEFMLKGDAAAGLTIESVTRVSDTEVTLILGGTPKTAGDFEVDAEHTAFTYDPGMEESAGTFTVNPAPEITLTADPASVTAGLELGTVTITAENGTFLSQLGADLFTITSPDGIAEGLEITDVTVADDGTTVTLTVTGAPAKDGTLIITVDPTAFAIRPASGPEAKIAVAKLTGSVSMALAGGTLTAGTAADGLTLELEAAGEGLTFGADAAPGDFLLTGPGAEGLTVAGVTRTDGTHVSLTLKGVPAKAGELGVTVKTTAFDVPPTDGQDVTAAPSVTVAYPTVSLTPAPASVSQGVAIDTITLTAAGGVFNAIDGGTDGFAISGVTGVTLVAVSAKDGGDTATLTITGAPEQTGTLTVTVQPEAFKYQPEKAVTAAITVTGPTGTVAAALSDALYAYTPVAGQTITITISDSKGLSFRDGLTPDSFQLTGPAAEGLTVAGVTGSGSAVTLTLSGTPAAGSFTVTVLANAFTFDPGKDMDAGSVSVNPAPEVSVTAEPETITAGEAVGTITITAVGGTFASTADASLFALSGYGASGLTISAVTVDGSTATLTITGAPENAGTMTVTVSRAAFSPVAADDPTVEITVRAGSISTDVETGDGAPATSFGSNVADLADAVLDPEELVMLAEGATVTITLQEEDISDSVGTADKAAAEAAAGNYAVGTYLDLSLIKSVNDKQSAVHETNKPIVIVISVPTGLQSANRVFAVVRVHDGTGTMLNDLDSNPNTITIATDRFSTYAIVYRDGSATTPTPAPPAPSASTTPTAPDTGDEAAPALWLGLLALCAGALVLAGGLLRRRSGTR